MIEILTPEITEAALARDRELELQRALAESARDLSVDERYILRRMAAIVAQDPASATSFPGLLLGVTVAEFALHAGLTPKVAYRRLDVAAHAIFDRSVTLVSEEGDTTVFRWVTGLGIGNDLIDLTFTGTFINFLYSRLGGGGARAFPKLSAITGAVQAQASVCQEDEGLFAFPIEIKSRRDARQKRPNGMPFTRLFTRVTKRLKSLLNKEQLWDIEDAVYRDSPWTSRTNPRYYKYTHKDLRKLHDWVVAYLMQHGFPG
ncbi:hypothetical protein ACHMW6_28935 [Pseudoduganella sp. UC29_106]|uniref:hypothetical protein n=1 Tax=Pseudoduganella sp. UC29_106 TaxID=3374553 RepID=UPI00375738D2